MHFYFVLIILLFNSTVYWKKWTDASEHVSYHFIDNTVDLLLFLVHLFLRWRSGKFLATSIPARTWKPPVQKKWINNSGYVCFLFVFCTLQQIMVKKSYSQCLVCTCACRAGWPDVPVTGLSRIGTYFHHLSCVPYDPYQLSLVWILSHRTIFLILMASH